MNVRPPLIGSWALSDHRGTVRDIVDDTDPTAIAEHRKFDSFGNMTGNTLDMPQAYTGRIWDADVGLYDYRARWYDASGGVFCQRRPQRLRRRGCELVSLLQQ